jgi:S-DNA-T family DNA segregation ATPase FtsK/SpoIIIE
VAEQVSASGVPEQVTLPGARPPGLDNHGRAPAIPPLTEDTNSMTEPAEHHEGDAEVFPVEPVRYGGPVDPPDEPTTLYGTITASRNHDREPLIPGWVRNQQQRVQVAKDAANLAGYVAAKHTLKSPKYAGKTLLWGTFGAFIGLGRLLGWVLVGDAKPIILAALAAKDHAEARRTWEKAGERRPLRVGVFAAVVLLAAVGTLALVGLTPRFVQVSVGAVALIGLAWYGRPADRPIIDRTTIGPKFVRLTAEMVRDALCNIGLAGIKEPGQLTFPHGHGGVKRDGPGWMAVVDLPQGIEAIDVIQRRGKLSSALRLPVDQVWPEKGPDHAGQLALWVARVPMAQMGRTKWQLVKPGAVTSIFEPIPFGTDPRLRPVCCTMFQRNFLIGGQPGSGKTFGCRALVGGALLDPTAEVWIAAFKASEDFYDFSPFCARYACGIDDDTFDAAEQMINDAMAEVRRRQALLGKLKREGKILEGRTSPELARAGIGLHPLILFFDEFHELLIERPDAGKTLIRVVKQGRSAGVIAVMATQVAGKDSIPPELTRVTSSRWCMSVKDQVANDQIMGTGAYKQGLTGTVYRPEIDAGWGATDGMAHQPGPVRAYYPNADELKVLIERIGQLRGGGANLTATQADRRDVLDDVLHVFATFGRRGIHWVKLAELLAAQYPEYEGISADAVSALMRNKGVPTEQVKVDGINQWGCKKVAVETAAKKALESGK